MPAAEPLDLSYIANPAADRLERLAAQLHRRLDGGNVTADSRYGRREIMLALEEFRGKRQAEINLYNADRQEKYALEAADYNRKQYYEDYEAIYKLGGTNEQWIRHYDLQVFDDAARRLKYCVLPQQFLDIRRYQNLPPEQGIMRVERVVWAANQNFAARYIPVTSGQHSLVAGLYRGGMQGNIMVVRDEDRAYLTPDPVTLSIKDELLRFYFVVRPERDGLPAPGLMADVSDMDMVMGAEAIVLRRAPEDLVNDNVPTPSGQAQ